MDPRSLQNFINRALVLSNSAQTNGSPNSVEQWLHSSSLMWICLTSILLSWVGTVVIRLIFPKSFFLFLASLTYSYVAVASSTVILTLMIWTSFNSVAYPQYEYTTVDPNARTNPEPNQTPTRSPNQSPTQPPDQIGPDHLPTPTPDLRATPRPPD